MVFPESRVFVEEKIQENGFVNGMIFAKRKVIQKYWNVVGRLLNTQIVIQLIKTTSGVEAIWMNRLGY